MPGAALCVANLLINQKRITDAGRKAVEKWGNDTIKISKEDYCPIDTGLLKGTGESRIHKNTLTEFYVRLSYSTPYAPYVHEIPAYYHPIGQYKFLSTPFNIRSKLLVEMIENAMRAVL
jgi:hypothetical protein